MIVSDHGKMLGICRHPFCGKCCGEHTKKGNTVNKRAERRHNKQMFKQSVR